MASEVDVADALQECAEAWEPDVCVLGNVRARDVIAVCERLREAERERDEARAALALEERLKLEACNQAETEAARAEAAEARWHAEHATALEALRQAEAAEARVAELQATAVAPEPEAKDAATLAFDAIARAVGCPEWDYPGQLVRDVERLRKERDEARTALIRSQEDHRAAVEALETYEERIGDIADHVLGLVPPDVPSIVKLDAIERRCGEERVAARQAERERDEARAALATVNDIRNSIIGAQTVNWSEHVYPLVAALDAAGFAGMPYPEARENVGTAEARGRERGLEEAARECDQLAGIAERGPWPGRRHEYTSAAKRIRALRSGR